MSQGGRVGWKSAEYSPLMRFLPSLRRFSNGPGTELLCRLESLETRQNLSKALAKTPSLIQTLSNGARTCRAARQHLAVGRDGIERGVSSSSMQTSNLACKETKAMSSNYSLIFELRGSKIGTSGVVNWRSS